MENLFDQIKLEITEKGFYVYEGKDKKNNSLVYIGTTTQIPKDRFRWHKANGKDLNFTVIQICESIEQMIDVEFELIKKHRPKLNKIVKRKQNYNRKLDETTLQSRIGNKEWCQVCLKRRVNKGYSKCYYC